MSEFKGRVEYVDWRDIHSKDCIEEENAIEVVRVSVIEEAKKEFPNRADDKYWDNYDGEGKPPPEAFDEYQYHQDLDTWFNKWFGDE